MNDTLPGGSVLIPLTVKGDARGSLIAIEQGREMSFEITRVYYLFGTRPGVTRGLHAHRKLRQFAVAIAGSCNMLLDDGTCQETIRLEDPAQGLLLSPLVWHEMTDFTPDCVLMVLADAPYDESDYIRDYDAFLSYVGSPRA
jgi:dTDP-4-dehydrorhamnose 3,5-epimerase-like enzyme